MCLRVYVFTHAWYSFREKKKYFFFSLHLFSFCFELIPLLILHFLSIILLPFLRFLFVFIFSFLILYNSLFLWICILFFLSTFLSNFHYLLSLSGTFVNLYISLLPRSISPTPLLFQMYHLQCFSIRSSPFSNSFAFYHFSQFSFLPLANYKL